MAEGHEKLASVSEEHVVAGASEAGAKLAENPRTFTLWQRVQISFASWVGYLALLMIGLSLRWDVVGWENWEAACKLGKGLIYTCWHRVIFAGTWFWRNRGIVAMASQNFDGEYIARILQKCGYGTARGSSTRGGVRALAEMIECQKKGVDTVLTIDGPRGPRFLAKPGSVLLAKATGAPILCFHVALRSAHVFKKSWDLLQLPYPFSRAAMFIAPPIVVPPEADEEEQSRKLAEVQATLDGLRRRGEEWSGRTP